MATIGKLTGSSHQRPDARDELRQDVLDGLCRDRKELSPKHLYDDRGARLYDDICELDDYYPTRTELAIMQAHMAEMTAALGPKCVLIEFGAGSGLKTRLLLEHLATPIAYVPIDIAEVYLEQTTAQLRSDFPDLTIRPICADFTRSG